MSYEDLLIHSVTITNPGAQTGTDRYNNPVFAAPTNTVELGRIQQLSPQEIVIDRDTRITSHRIFLKSDSVVTALSTIAYGGHTYMVDGQPWIVDGRTGPHHIEAMLREIEG